METKFDKWMIANGIKNPVAAAALKTTKLSISRYRNGHRFPEPEMIVAIAIYSKRAVMPEDWFDDHFPRWRSAVLDRDFEPPRDRRPPRAVRWKMRQRKRASDGQSQRQRSAPAA